mmetsp:Transcript_20043/g.46668  ORF Transcript_20043/g.46668 Transcript_20043/m.46668 type:complete len:883 (-) Transcript_20043:106-2754(-)
MLEAASTDRASSGRQPSDTLQLPGPHQGKSGNTLVSFQTPEGDVPSEMPMRLPPPSPQAGYNRRKDSLGSEAICWSNPLSSRGSVGSLNVALSGAEESYSKAKLTVRESIDVALNQNIAWAIVVGILTVWALYADDLKRLCLPKESDLSISILNWIILVIFIAEFALCSVVQQGYVLSLQAFMDFLAVLSLVPIEDVLRGLSEVGGDISVARVARATRALRILRATRAATMALKSQKQFRNVNLQRKGRGDADQESKSVLEETLVTRTNLKMLLGILVLLIGTSLMEYTEVDRSAPSGLEMLDRSHAYSCSADEANWQELTNTYIAEVEEDKSVREVMILVVRGDVVVYKDTGDLRRDEIETHEVGGQTAVDISIKRLRQTEAGFSIGLTTFTVLGILIWTGSFSRDHQQLVLEPVHRMIGLLRTMAKDPRLAISTTELRGSQKGEAVTEMEAIESCLFRFGQLLKVGFGEAGLDVISKNLSLEGGRFDPMIPGTIVFAVFGFCDIRNFTDCCEVLNEDTMLFTNRIANIVHELVQESGGHVNKNIGDAFLSVWKLRLVEDGLNGEVGTASYAPSSVGAGFKPGDSTNLPVSSAPPTPRQGPSPSYGASQLSPSYSTGISPSGGAVPSPSCGNLRTEGTTNFVSSRGMGPGLTRRDSKVSGGGGKRYRHHLTDAEGVIDQSLRAFIKMQASLKHSRSIQTLCKDPRLQSKLPGYTVKMGYGLHLGWAVEGAVGSKHKVDATYLSPNVNMASRLEAATKQYGVSILMSHTVVDEMSEGLQRECRPVDRVTVKGSSMPIGLWVHMPTEAPHLRQEELAEFMSTWNEIFQSYVDGVDWGRALELMVRCQEILPDDGPCQIIREVMEEHGGLAPPEWPGYHKLTSK